MPSDKHSRKPKPSEEKAKDKKAKDRTVAITEATAPSWERFSGRLDELPILAAEMIALQQQVNEAEARKKEIRERVEELLQSVNEPKVRGDFFVANRFATKTPTRINERKLLEQGVESEVIDAAKEGGDTYYITKITAVDSED